MSIRFTQLNSTTKFENDDVIALDGVTKGSRKMSFANLQNEILGGGSSEEAIQEWLDNHPEATTTVEDGSLTYKKLVNGTLNFVTPEMFGAVGDGVTDDTASLQAATNSGYPVYLGKKKYRVTNSVTISKDVYIFGGTLHIDSFPPSDYAKYLFISRDNAGQVIKFNNVKFESTQDQVCYDTRETFYTEVPVSNTGVYHNLVDVTSVSFENCTFKCIDHPVKLVNYLGTLSFDNCELTSFINGVYANNVGVLSISSCVFKQMPEAAVKHHGVYFQGNGKLWCFSTYMDCPNFCIHGWDDEHSNNRDIEVVGCFFSGVSVMCNYGGAGCNTIVHSSYLEGQRLIYSTDAKVCNCTLAHRTDFPDGTHLFSGTHCVFSGYGHTTFTNCDVHLGSGSINNGSIVEFKDCSLSLDTNFYNGSSDGAIKLRFDNCSIHSTLIETFSIRSDTSSVTVLNCVLDLKNYVFYNSGAAPSILVASSTIFCNTSHVGIPGFVPADYNTLVLPSLQS